MPTSSSSSETSSSHLVSALNRIAFLIFSLYLTLLLGSGSVARLGGPISWLPIGRLPDATSGWAPVGVVVLLPPLSIIAWLSARKKSGTLQSLTWGWNRVSWPLMGLSALGLVSLLSQCPGQICNTTTFVRLLLLVAHLAWVYLYVVNENPDLLPVAVGIIFIQSTVAIGQFTAQGDLGLSFLGENSLDPLVSGVSVVMRGSERWLRGYGLTTHPNILARTLVSILLMLPILVRQSRSARRSLGALVFVLGFAALLTTLARWATACLAIGLSFTVLHWLIESLRLRRRIAPPLGIGAWIAVCLIAILFLGIYGDTVVGRVANLYTPVENRSIWERNRDTAISLKVIAAAPLTGVGLSNYVSAARSYDAWAEVVHNVPLLLAAELGLGGLALWLWLIAAPVLRRGALGRFASETGMWLGFWLLGLFYPGPYPLYELRSALLVGMVAGLMGRSGPSVDSEDEHVEG